MATIFLFLLLSTFHLAELHMKNPRQVEKILRTKQSLNEMTANDAINVAFAVILCIFLFITIFQIYVYINM